MKTDLPKGFKRIKITDAYGEEIELITTDDSPEGKALLAKAYELVSE